MNECRNGAEPKRKGSCCGCCNTDGDGGARCDEKTAVDNRWVSTGACPEPDERERRDGPGGEDADD